MADEPPVPEDRLLERAGAGDARAIDALLQRHVPHLRRYLAKNAAGLIDRRESMSDLVQSVCREAIEHAADGRLEARGDGQFRVWLYRAAMLKMKNRRRYWNAEGRDRARESPLQETGATEAGAARAPGADDPSPSEAAIDNEDAERLARAFAQLDEDQQSIILLVHVDGLTHEEIAKRLDLTPAHSRTRLSRALARLATLASAS